jgi:hypothetical protein
MDLTNLKAKLIKPTTMVIDGKLLEKSETQQVSDSFRKREFVVEFAENSQYPEYLKFEMIQANCDQLDNFNPGDEIRISFNLKGRKWTDPQGQVKYFNSLQAWRLEPKAVTATSEAPPTWTAANFAEEDDLPF